MKTITQRANDYVAALGTLIKNYMENAYLAGEAFTGVLGTAEQRPK